MANHLLQHRQHQGQARLQLAVVLAKALHQARLAAAGDLDAANSQQGHQHQGGQGEQSFHGGNPSRRCQR